MDTITEALKKEIPEGNWCHSHLGWCKYHEIKKPTLDAKGTIKCYFCNLQEEFINRKTCGINE